MSSSQGVTGIEVLVHWNGTQGWNDPAPEDIAPYIVPGTLSLDTGRPSELEPGTARVSSLQCQLDNSSGRFTRRLSTSPLNQTPKSIGLGRPVRVRIKTLATPLDPGQGRLLAMDGDGDELWLVDRDDPTASTLVGSLPGTLNVPTGMAYHEGELLCLDNSGDELWLVDLGNPANSTKIGDLPAGLTRPQGLASHNGDLLAVDASGNELWLVDRDNPSSSTLIGALPTALANVYGLTSHDNDLLGIGDAPNNKKQLCLIDRTTPANSTGIGNLPQTFASPNGLASFNGDLLGVDAGVDGLWLIDRDDPESDSERIGLLPGTLTRPLALSSDAVPSTATVTTPATGVPGTTWSGYLARLDAVATQNTSGYTQQVEMVVVGPDYKWLQDTVDLSGATAAGTPMEAVTKAAQALSVPVDPATPATGISLSAGNILRTAITDQTWSDPLPARDILDWVLQLTQGSYDPQYADRGQLVLREWNWSGDSTKAVELTISDEDLTKSDIAGGGLVKLDDIHVGTYPEKPYSSYKAHAENASQTWTPVEPGSPYSSWILLAESGTWPDWAPGSSAPAQFSGFDGLSDVEPISDSECRRGLHPTGNIRVPVTSSLLSGGTHRVWHYRCAFVESDEDDDTSSQNRGEFTTNLLSRLRRYGTHSLNADRVSFNLNITRNSEVEHSDDVIRLQWVGFYGARERQVSKGGDQTRTATPSANRTMHGSRNFPVYPGFEQTTDADTWLTRVARRYGKIHDAATVTITPDSAAEVELLVKLRSGSRVKLLTKTATHTHFDDVMLVRSRSLRVNDEGEVRFTLDLLSHTAWHA